MYNVESLYTKLVEISWEKVVLRFYLIFSANQICNLKWNNLGGSTSCLGYYHNLNAMLLLVHMPYCKENMLWGWCQMIFPVHHIAQINKWFPGISFLEVDLCS